MHALIEKVHNLLWKLEKHLRRVFINNSFEISGAVIDMNFFPAGEDGAKSTLEVVQVKDADGFMPTIIQCIYT